MSEISETDRFGKAEGEIEEKLTIEEETELKKLEKTDLEEEFRVILHQGFEMMVRDIIRDQKWGGMSHTTFYKGMSRYLANQVRYGVLTPAQGIAKLSKYVRVFEES